MVSIGIDNILTNIRGGTCLNSGITDGDRMRNAKDEDTAKNNPFNVPVIEAETIPLAL